MLSRFRGLPSPALVIASIALIFAVGGGSFAIGALTKPEKKVVKKISRKVANTQIKRKAPGLSVANAANLGGLPASFYAPASTLRTAVVAANGDVNAARSDGVSQANVTAPVDGIYCFDGLSPAPRSVVASIASGQAQIQTQVQYAPGGGQCAGKQFSIATVDDANNLNGEPFTVFIH